MSSHTTVTSPVRADPSGGAHRLVVLFDPSGQDEGTSVALGTSNVCIGREPPGRLDLELRDVEVSRAHACVEPEEDGWTIRDLGSRNGTFVGGSPVTVAPLRDGDVIRTGAHLILFQFVDLEDVRRASPGRDADSPLIGQSFAIARLRDDVAHLGPKDTTVLIVGESGVGKELVAQELHRASRRSGPLVAVNCAALPEQLAESELFGHTRGAFTGASTASEGLFGAAHGGTIFLDEIGEMPRALQAKLLRALATGEVRAVGQTHARRVDARVVAATNIDLADAIETGRFRGDLWARLSGAVIQVPPLRARRDDVLPLVRTFLRKEGAPVEPSCDAAEALLVHAWPYNVRDLQQVAAAAADAARAAGRLELEHLPDPIRAPIQGRRGLGPAGPAEVPLELRVRRDGTPRPSELEEVLRHFGGNVARVAAFFGKERRQIYRWAKRMGVNPEAFRDG